MKKLFINLSVIGLLSAGMVGCGPSAEEIAAAEQRVKDSIAEVQRIEAELMAAQQKATEDSLALIQAAEDAAKATADSIAAAKGKPKPAAKPKPAPQPTKPEEVKPGQGRG